MPRSQPFKTVDHLLSNHLKVPSRYDHLGYCHEWQGCLTKRGYGNINKKWGERRVHRLSYKHQVGEIPEGKEVCHHCDNPKCINHLHLFVASHRANLNDAAMKGRTNSKLSHDQAREIKRLWSTGNYLIKEIAKKYDVNQSSISRIVKGSVHRHA
jgi:hypothetical protein